MWVYIRTLPTPMGTMGTRQIAVCFNILVGPEWITKWILIFSSAEGSNEYRSDDWWRLPRKEDLHSWKEIDGKSYFFVATTLRDVLTHTLYSRLGLWRRD